MGFLKKIFKPVSKVLDKVLPNEIKPFLPYAAAFAPFIAPGIMGTSVLQRAAMGGGLNIFGQLAQEGNEGDINLLSAGLGALSGAMTGPNAASDFRAMQSANKLQDANIARTGLQKGMDLGLEGLAKGSEMFAAGMKDPFSMAGLKAATLPVATATGDLMFAQAKRDQDEYDRMMEEDAASDAESDAQRAFAIRRAMEATGATEEEIEDAIYAAGYKTGGRVGLRFGGIGDAVENIEDTEMKEAAKFAMQDMDIPIMDLVEEFEIQFKRKPNSMEELKQFYKDRYEYKGPGDVKMKEEIKEKVVMEAKDGGRIGLQEGGTTSAFQQLVQQPQAVQNAPMFLGRPAFTSPLQQAGAVFPRLNQLEQGVNRAEGSLNRIRNRLGEDQRQLPGLIGLQPALGLQPFNMGRLPGTLQQLANRDEPVAQGMKDGGRIGFKDGSDGSSTGNFGADRYASELVEAYGSILNKGDMFLTDVEKELIERGEYPSPDKMKDFQTRYENLEKEYEKEEDKFGNIDLQDSLLDEDAIKYYNKKVKDLEDKEDRLMDKEEKLNEVMYTDLDVSGILKTPEFQEWYKLWKVNDPKADDLPNAEYFENMMFDVKRLRPDVMKTKYDVEMKDGGLMDLGGKEMDLRKGGFVPIGKKERADDVPARLSKNEFVMTADAVRAAGGGSVNEGAKRMYKVMNDLEARA